MSSFDEKARCERADLVAPYALSTLDRGESEVMQAHLPGCADCQREFEAIAPVTDALSAWRTQSFPPPMPLWDRVLERLDKRSEQIKAPSAASESARAAGWREPEWRNVAPGIACKLLSTDSEQDRVTMLVRLAPDASYPPHQHSSVEELYLLEGELWIDDRKLVPGDYSRAERGTSDQRVWSQTGCMCLLITSPSDQLQLG
jgi:anti-sigma factor ChrR (cupin superfamily)